MTEENAGKLFAGLPLGFALLRLAANKVEYGSLCVTLPDGRKFRFNGKQAGDKADLTLHNFNIIKSVVECIRRWRKLYRW